MERREFVVRATGAGAALSMFPAGLSGLERGMGPGGLERRSLGKTGEKLSIIGFGGIVVMNATAVKAARGCGGGRGGGQLLRCRPRYGNAEDMFGPALEPWRERVFLACKTDDRSEGRLTAQP